MKDVKLYSRLDNHDTVIEIWGASTKHPDVVFTLDKKGCRKTGFKNNPLCDRWAPTNIYQWLCSVQGALLFPINSLSLLMNRILYKYDVLW